jgi:hypothetical protein
MVRGYQTVRFLIDSIDLHGFLVFRPRLLTNVLPSSYNASTSCPTRRYRSAKSRSSPARSSHGRVGRFRSPADDGDEVGEIAGEFTCDVYVDSRDKAAHASMIMDVCFVNSALLERQVGDSAKLSQDVISALIKSSTVFINYLGQSRALFSIYNQKGEKC